MSITTLPNILVLCTGNSCRSQLLHGYLQQLLGERAAVYSAGVETHGLNPRAVQVMAEDGVDISHHTSNHVDEYAAVPFDYVLTVCDHAQEVCPVFPSSARKLHHNFPDPAKATGSEAEVLGQFRAVRNQVKAYAQDVARQYFPA
ncbi:MAG: arsenate reductase ArsC [Janthinobacterium lividum]